MKESVRMKKGFTLIEILVVITLIGILATTSFISLGKVNDARIENEYNKKVENFIDAAEVYIDNNTDLREKVYNKVQVNVTLNNLADKDLIEKNIINPYTNKVFNYDSFIEINYQEKLIVKFNIIE